MPLPAIFSIYARYSLNCMATCRGKQKCLAHRNKIDLIYCSNKFERNPLPGKFRPA